MDGGPRLHEGAGARRHKTYTQEATPCPGDTQRAAGPSEHRGENHGCQTLCVATNRSLLNKGQEEKQGVSTPIITAGRQSRRGRDARLGKGTGTSTETWLWPNMRTMTWDGAGPGKRSSSPTWQGKPGHPSLAGPAPVPCAEQAPSRASQGLLQGAAPPPQPEAEGSRHGHLHLPTVGCLQVLLSPYFQFWSKPVPCSLLFGNFNACMYREREREAISVPTTCSKAGDFPALGRCPRWCSRLQEMGTGHGPQG